MRVLRVSTKPEELDVYPGGGFVAIRDVTPAELETGLKDWLPHVVAINVTKLAATDVAATDVLDGLREIIFAWQVDECPTPLLLTGYDGHPNADYLEVVRRNTLSDEDLCQLAVEALTSSGAPRLLYVDDDPNELNARFGKAPFAACASANHRGRRTGDGDGGIWLVPIHFEQQHADVLASNRWALRQLVALACNSVVLLDIKLIEASYAVAVATALLHGAPDCVVQPISGLLDQTDFSVRAGLLSRLFPGQLKVNQSKNNVPSSPEDIPAWVTCKRCLGAASPRTKMPNELNVSLTLNSAILSTLAFFDRRLPWELAGTGQDGSWIFQPRPLAPSAPVKGNYEWLGILRNHRDFPAGWLESGHPHLLDTCRRESHVVLPKSCLGGRSEVMGFMTRVLATPSESILDLAKHPAASDWIEWMHKRIKIMKNGGTNTKWVCAAQPLDTVLKRIRGSAYTSKTLLELLWGPTRSALLAAAYDASKLAHEDAARDREILAVLGVQELFRSAQASTKSVNICGRRVILLLDAMNNDQTLTTDTLNYVDKKKLTKDELAALRTHHELALRLLVSFTLSLPAGRPPP